MRLSSHCRSFVLAALVVSVTGAAQARPFRVNEVPNGPVAACFTCHVYPGGPRTAFGETIEHYGGVGFLVDSHVQWSNLALVDPAHPGEPAKTLAQIDSDGDGRTNGEEMLDPNGAWSIGQAQPGNGELVRLPGLADVPVVIRQIYPGASAATVYQSDFVELFNRSQLPVSLAGWSLQYAPATGQGNFGSDAARRTELPPVILQPGQSYLVQEATAPGGSALPVADFVDETPILLGDSAGKLALVAGVTSLPCNGFPTVCSDATLAQILDLVGYGGSALYYEGMAPAPGPSSTQAMTRARRGCTDINNNGPDDVRVPSDFTLAAPVLRSAATPLWPCGAAAPPTPPAMPAPALAKFPLALLALLLGAFGGWCRRRVTAGRCADQPGC